MKFLKAMKDGGPESTSTGYWLIEWKKAFSIVLLRFDGKSREAFHTHAFDCLSWVIKGGLRETFLKGTVPEGEEVRFHLPSFKPFITRRTDFHKVDAYNPYRNDNDTLVSWVFSIRGPWVDKWKEWLPNEQKTVNLTHGRVVTN